MEMRLVGLAILMLVVASCAGFSRQSATETTVGLSTTAGSQDLGGSWTLRICNLKHKEVSSMIIRFAKDPAPSCLSGDWKRVVVETTKTTDGAFFPVSDPLSYNFEGSELTIGRNQVCDDYLHLHGKLDGDKAYGSYSGFGIAGGEQLGYFYLTRNR